MTRRPGTSGAAAVEFALAGTVLLIVIFGVVEWSWYLYQHLALVRASDRGARLAAATPTEGDPAVEAQAAVDAALRQFGLDPARAMVQTTRSGAAGAEVITVQVELSGAAMVGISLVPDSTGARASQHFEAVGPVD